MRRVIRLQRNSGLDGFVSGHDLTPRETTAKCDSNVSGRDFTSRETNAKCDNNESGHDLGRAAEARPFFHSERALAREESAFLRHNRQLLLVAAVVLASALSALASSKPIAKMELPCSAYFQTLSPDGTQLVVTCRGMSMVVLSVPDGKTLRTVPAEQKPYASAYSHDGKWLAIGYQDGTVEITSTKDSAPAKRWQAGPRRIDLLAFLPDGKTLVVGPSDDAARIWSLTETPKLLTTLPFEFGGVSAAAASPDGKLLAIAGGDTAVRLYDTTTWQTTHENRSFLLETFALEFTPDGKQVLVGGADARITVLDAATAQQVKQLPTDDGSYIVGLAMMGDKHSAATVYLDDAGHKPPHAVVWDLASGKSSALGDGVVPTCGEKVAGKLWMCTTEGKTLNLAQYD